MASTDPLSIRQLEVVPVRALLEQDGKARGLVRPELPVALRYAGDELAKHCLRHVGWRQFIRQ